MHQLYAACSSPQRTCRATAAHNKTVELMKSTCLFVSLSKSCSLSIYLRPTHEAAAQSAVRSVYSRCKQRRPLTCAGLQANPNSLLTSTETAGQASKEGLTATIHRIASMKRYGKSFMPKLIETLHCLVSTHRTAAQYPFCIKALV